MLAETELSMCRNSLSVLMEEIPEQDHVTIKEQKKQTKCLLNLPKEHVGISTPAVANISFISDSTNDRIAAGLGQSIPFIGTGFQIPRVTSAEK